MIQTRQFTITFLSHSAIDKKKWDDCILHSLNGRVYATAWYLDSAAPGWSALVEGDYESVMPLTSGKKHGFDYLFQPHFAQQLGVFSTKISDEKTVRAFLSAIPDKFRYVDICLNSRNQLRPSPLHAFTVNERANYELFLNLSYPEISGNYSENTKRNISKAITANLEIFNEGITAEDIIGLFKQDKPALSKKLKKEYFDRLKKISVECISRKCATITGVKNSSSGLIAAALFITYRQRVLFLFSGNSEEGKKKGALPFLIDRFICEHAGTNMTLDFEGSDIAGIARFYKSFGAQESVYLRFRKNTLPKIVRWLKK